MFMGHNFHIIFVTQIVSRRLFKNSVFPKSVYLYIYLCMSIYVNISISIYIYIYISIYIFALLNYFTNCLQGYCVTRKLILIHVYRVFVVFCAVPIMMLPFQTTYTFERASTIVYC